MANLAREQQASAGCALASASLATTAAADMSETVLGKVRILNTTRRYAKLRSPAHALVSSRQRFALDCPHATKQNEHQGTKASG